MTNNTPKNSASFSGIPDNTPKNSASFSGTPDNTPKNSASFSGTPDNTPKNSASFSGTPDNTPKNSVLDLQIRAAKCRLNVLRMMRASGAGHMGGAMSAVDILSALYFKTMRCDPKNPKLPDRDRFVLSAGHKCMALYAVLAEAEYFDPNILDTYGQLKSRIPGHPDMYKLPGVEANTGALGHGLSISVGMALGLRAAGRRVFTVLGDGELPEGSNWEAAAAAAHYGLDNLTAIVDNNGLQISGAVTDVMNMQPIAAHFTGFGWAAKEIDGNNIKEITAVLDSLPFEKNKPSIIVAHTIKAKGISFAENKTEYHYWKPAGDELETAEAELRSALKELEAQK